MGRSGHDGNKFCTVFSSIVIFSIHFWKIIWIWNKKTKRKQTKMKRRKSDQPLREKREVISRESEHGKLEKRKTSEGKGESVGKGLGKGSKGKESMMRKRRKSSIKSYHHSNMFLLLTVTSSHFFMFPPVRSNMRDKQCSMTSNVQTNRGY
jgi:hypothetical protein